MARVKRSVWISVFNSTVASAKRLIQHPDQLRELIEEALIKMQKHSAAIREIVADLQITGQDWGQVFIFDCVQMNCCRDSQGDSHYLLRGVQWVQKFHGSTRRLWPLDGA